jgi:hypothetical protein
MIRHAGCWASSRAHVQKTTEHAVERSAEAIRASRLANSRVRRRTESPRYLSVCSPSHPSARYPSACSLRAEPSFCSPSHPSARYPSAARCTPSARRLLAEPSFRSPSHPRAEPSVRSTSHPSARCLSARSLSYPSTRSEPSLHAVCSPSDPSARYPSVRSLHAVCSPSHASARCTPSARRAVRPLD